MSHVNYYVKTTTCCQTDCGKDCSEYTYIRYRLLRLLRLRKEKLLLSTNLPLDVVDWGVGVRQNSVEGLNRLRAPI
jgi:hypothetical protein